MNIKKLFKNKKGVTLTETIIYISLISIVTVALISITIQIVQFKTRANSMSIISSEVSNVFDKVIYEVRNADSFEVVDSSTLKITKDSVIGEYRLENSRIVYNREGGDNFVTSNQVEVNDVQFLDWTSVNSDNLLHIIITFKRGSINETFQTTVHKR